VQLWIKRGVLKEKNAKCEFKNRMICIRGTRAKIGKTTTFIFNDKLFSDAKLNRYIAYKKLNEANVMAEGHHPGGNCLLLILPPILISS